MVNYNLKNTKMDSKTIITFLLLVVAVIIPFILLHLSHRLKERKIYSELSGLTGLEKVHFQNIDHWRNSYAIATDQNSENIYYLNRKKGQKYLIEIKEVEGCKAITSARGVKTGDGMNNVVEKMDLVLTFRNKELPDKALEFFDGEVFMTVDGEAPLLEKWERIINSAIKKRL
jgi:hypothetical protein